MGYRLIVSPSGEGWIEHSMDRFGGRGDNEERDDRHMHLRRVPYDSVRKVVRSTIEPYCGFVLVHVATPLEVCEQRDRKGFYAKARAGIIKDFTGISDPYEAPDDAELVIDTTDTGAEEAAHQIILRLERDGYVGASATR